MQVYFPMAVAAVLGLAAVTVAAQDDAELVFNATHRNIYCVAPDVGEVFDPPPKRSDPTKVLDVNGMKKDEPCGKLADHNGFLVQEKRSELRVFRRKFLTRYSLFVDSVTKIQSFRTQDLNTAANLTTPLSNAVTGVSKGAAPKGLATNGALTLRNAQDLVAELLNPATASNAVSEIASDWVMVKREAENVLNDARSFQATWSIVAGPPPVTNPCLSGYAAANLISTNECLDQVNQAEESGSFSRTLPTYSDEDAFRALLVKDNAAIAMVASLANQLSLQTPSLSNQVSSFDGDLAILRADMNTLAGNVEAIEDASILLGSITPDMTRAQIKERLILSLTGGSKPAVDDAELTRLTEQYYEFTRGEAAQHAVRNAQFGIADLWRDGLRQMDDMLAAATAIAGPGFPPDGPCQNNPLEGQLVRVRCWAERVDARYSFLLNQDHERFSDELPTQIAGINIKQSILLARTNEIYDTSQVDVPLDVGIVLNGQKGNLRVYFTIYETETFPRFSVPSTLGGPIVTANSAAITAPPVTTSSTNTTSTASATAGSNTATTTTPTTPTQPSGLPATSGSFEVHDRYNAAIVAAFAFSPGLKETSISTNIVTTGTATGSTTANPIPCNTTNPCTQVTKSVSTGHNSVIAGMAFHPWGYDRFPGADSWKHPSQALKHEFGIFGGLSVQNLNDYYFGCDLQIAHGIQIMGGVNFFRQNTLAPSFVSGGIYPGTPTFTGPEQWTHGAYFGIGLNLRIFQKGFGSVTQLGSATTSTGS